MIGEVAGNTLLLLLAGTSEAGTKLWMIFGAVLLYVASAVLAEVLSNSSPARLGMRGLGHWLVIALVVLVVMATRTADFTQRANWR